MRSTRWLLLLAILAIVSTVGTAYFIQKRLLKEQAPQAPQSLPVEVKAAADDWRWSHTVEGRPVVEVRARNFRQVSDPSRFDLERVELRLYRKDGKEFDQVRSARAEFNLAAATLYSEGEVEITLGVPKEGAAGGRLVSIRSSGVSFQSKTGKASTERPARFTFEHGEGQAIGAWYDPGIRELHMLSQVEVRWRGQGPGGKVMTVEAGELAYWEQDSKIKLLPWSRLSRENLVLEAGDAFVMLEEGAVRRVEAQRARGVDRYPTRNLEYAADQLTMKFSNYGEVEKITGERNARLVSLSESTNTTVTTSRVDLEFETASGESQLVKALATGNGVVESRPVPRDGRPQPETRVLRSDAILLQMRPGGGEIQSVETHSPSTLEFLPNRPGQRKRRVDGERMWISYGPRNEIRSLRSVNVRTRTEPAGEAKEASGPVAETSSKDLAAEFDPDTGGLKRLEQWTDFRYREGARNAWADRAVLEPARNLITLEGSARLSDASGTTSANRILLDQASGDVTAEGNVTATRLPDRKGRSSSLLSHDEPLQATAERMSSTDQNQRTRYEGKAVLWQGANRLRADRIEIDRERKRLEARGQVTTQFLDRRREPAAAGKGQPPSFIVINAAELVYTEEDRLAHYKGGVLLARRGLEVKAAEIRGLLAEAKAESQIEIAYAEGGVEILEVAGDRRRKGAGEQAEYYAAEEKIVLHGGKPLLVDNLRGSARGRQLTYFAGSDRLLVDGLEDQPAVSRIRRKQRP